MAAAFVPLCALQGATESNNMVIKGVPSFYRKRKGNHIITTEIVRALGCPAMCFAPQAAARVAWLTTHALDHSSQEHKCVLDSCRWMSQQTERDETGAERESYRVTYLPVRSNGLVDLKELEDVMT